MNEKISVSTMGCGRSSITDRDVAMSLCALGQGHLNCFLEFPFDVGNAVPSQLAPNIVENDIQSNIIVRSQEQIIHLRLPLMQQVNGTPSKCSIDPKERKRDVSLKLDEMRRLMRVYGPIKVIRNRTPKESGKI